MCDLGVIQFSLPETTYFSTLANDDTTSGIEGKKTSDEPTPSQFPDWKYDYEDRGAQFLPDAIMRETNEAPLSTGNYLPALILIACLLLMVFAFAFALMIGIRSKRQSSISQCSKNYSRNNPDNSCTNSLGPLPPMVTSVWCIWCFFIQHDPVQKYVEGSALLHTGAR